MDDLRLLERDISGAFALSADGRIERGPPTPTGPRPRKPKSNDPAPRLLLAGCAGGNILRLRHDVDAGTAAQAEAIVADEPPWRDPDITPRGLGALVKLFARKSPVQVLGPEIVYRLPNGVAYEHEARIVRADTPAGDALIGRLERQGLPQPLLDAGFSDLGHLWWPWCAALEDEEIAAMAFAPRLTDAGAEVGVYTFPRFRGRGYAAATAAAWAGLPSLQDHTLVYSTRLNNRSSRKVAARLGLRPIGARVRIC